MPKFIEFGFTNLPETLQKLAKLDAQAMPALASALFEEAEKVMKVSKEQQVPVDTGNLKSTGQVQLPVISGSSVQVVMGYGNSAVDYALVVHEDLTARHHSGQKAKYLEDPLNEALPQFDQNMSKALQEVIDRTTR